MTNVVTLENAVKLSDLVSHTTNWLGAPATTVGSYARFIREARKISVGTTGGGAAEMTDHDKLTLLFGVAGCGTARTSGSEAPNWFNLRRDDQLFKRNRKDFGFKFVRALTFHEALSTLMTTDLRDGGAVAEFISASKASADARGIIGWLHEVQVEFHVDRFEAIIRIERELLGDSSEPDTLKMIRPVEGVLMRYEIYDWAPLSQPSRPYSGHAGAMSHLNVIRDHSLLGWGHCLEGSYSLA